MKKIKWKEIADWLGVNPPYLSRVINKKMNPGPQEAVRLEEVSGIPVRDWVKLEKKSLKVKIRTAYIFREGDLK